MTGRHGAVKLPRGLYVAEGPEFFCAKRLINLGRSKAIVVPRMWAEIFAPHGWVEMEVNGETHEIILRPMSPKKLKVVQKGQR